ncbi:hypothetical protein AB4Y40_40265 [Paraburkholderia sp. EG287B]|uniref:hypothetical protein n=1 Tax=Paraburkholderia sp. EG287B TaxID=3237010 RepID=UPI0034D1EED7
MSLLAQGARFENQGHDGRFTYKNLFATRGVRELFLSKLEFSYATISDYEYMPQTPRLAILAMVASASRQPLHRVILGQLGSWRGPDTSSMEDPKEPRKRDWQALEREFENLANSHTFINLGSSIKQVNISSATARKHFPDIVNRITQRGKLLRSERTVANKQVRLERIRDAFRMLIADGVYPSYRKISNLSGVDRRYFDRDCKALIEEWLRVEGEINFKRRGRASPPINQMRS